MTYNYFETIDTANKAYFLGLFHADGSCTSRTRGNNEEIRFQISLQIKDKEILEKFLLDVDLPPQRLKLYKSSRPNESDYAKLYLADKRFTKHLLDLKQESLIDRIPDIFMPDFVRGFFDGDGCIYVRRNDKKIFYYGVTFTCFGWIGEHLLKVLPFKTKLSIDKRSKDLTSLQTNKKENLILLFNYMYSNSETKLGRKFSKFKDAYEFASTTIPIGSRAK